MAWKVMMLAQKFHLKTTDEEVDISSPVLRRIIGQDLTLTTATASKTTNSNQLLSTDTSFEMNDEDLFINMLLTLLINGFRVPMFINMLITRLGIISPTLENVAC